MSNADRVRLDQAQLLIVDLQEKLLPLIANSERVVARSLLMIKAAVELGIPITLSEHYPRGLGGTPTELRDAASGAMRIEKISFSVYGDDAARGVLLERGRPVVLLVGIESHICVQQTALDMIADGKVRPVVLADAVSSQRELDHSVALERMRSAGVTVTTVESVLYEMLEVAGTPLFKRILTLVR